MYFKKHFTFLYKKTFTNIKIYTWQFWKRFTSSVFPPIPPPLRLGESTFYCPPAHP